MFGAVVFLCYSWLKPFRHETVIFESVVASPKFGAAAPTEIETLPPQVEEHRFS